MRANLRDLAMVLEQHGSASRLGPYINVLVPILRINICRGGSFEDHRSKQLLDLLKGWRAEARATMSEILSIDEPGRLLLHDFAWPQDDWRIRFSREEYCLWETNLLAKLHAASK